MAQAELGNYKHSSDTCFDDIPGKLWHGGLRRVHHQRHGEDIIRGDKMIYWQWLITFGVLIAYVTFMLTLSLIWQIAMF